MGKIGPISKATVSLAQQVLASSETVTLLLALSPAIAGAVTALVARHSWIWSLLLVALLCGFGIAAISLPLSLSVEFLGWSYVTKTLLPTVAAYLLLTVLAGALARGALFLLKRAAA